MRVLQLNHADVVGGGAAIACYRLHTSLRRFGVDSRLCVGTKASADETVEVLRQPRGARRALVKVGHELGLNELGGIGAYQLAHSDAVREADVVHAHALEGGWFSYPAMIRISATKPTVMTLHDMWPLTGHCSFAYDCGRWRSGCGRCPHPDTFPSVKRDATWVEWRLKKAVWTRSDLTIVAPSRWLAEEAATSTMGRFPIHHVPLGIDEEVFAPQPRDARRDELGIPEGNLALMFAAASLGLSRSGEINRKGSDLLLAALEALPQGVRQTSSTILMGASGAAMGARLRDGGFHVVDAGYVPDDAEKAALYGAADVFVCPTRADNSPLVVLEAMACGTPVAAFDVGGVSELVRHGDTGMLVAPGDVIALGDALVTAAQDREALHAMGRRARALIELEHREALAVDRHRSLYEELVG